VFVRTSFPSAVLDRAKSLANVITSKIGDSINAKATDRRLRESKLEGLVIPAGRAWLYATGTLSSSSGMESVRVIK
jgi:hypothetical protein